MGESTDFFLNPLKQVTKCCKMFTILADSFPSVLDDHERGTLHEELRRYDVWDPPAHIEAAFEQDNDSGIMISIRISADQYWQNVSHVKTGDLEFWQSSLQLCCAFHMAMPILNKYFLSSR